MAGESVHVMCKAMRHFDDSNLAASRIETAQSMPVRAALRRDEIPQSPAGSAC